MTAHLRKLCNADAAAPVILVVEDEVLLRLAAAQHLREAGYEVLEARNADEAMRLLEKADVDAVFSDITTPGDMDGLQLADWLREHRPEVGTVLTSGKLHPDGRYRFFLGKPYRLADLDLCLGEVLQQRSAEDAAPKRRLAALPGN
jgi:CheY-like chemotaxis protein